MTIELFAFTLPNKSDFEECVELDILKLLNFQRSDGYIISMLTTPTTPSLLRMSLHLAPVQFRKFVSSAADTSHIYALATGDKK
jgi:hypothetical protein